MDIESVASSSLRSPSPTASRSNRNFNIPDSSVRRKSFTGTASGRPSLHAIRRNFYPITPANSPASQEIPPRKIRASFEKENEKDRTASSSVRIQSPVVSKGIKNFMVPTISTASKVAASTKKKVLSERNETVSSSVSLSDTQSVVTSMNSLEFSGTEKACRKSEISSVSLALPATSQVSKQLAYRDQIHRAPVSLPNGNSPLVSEELSDISETGRDGSKMENVVGSEIKSDTPKLSISGEGPESVTLDNFKVTEPLKPQISEPFYKDDRLDSKEYHFSSKDSPHDSSRFPYDPKTNYLPPRPRFLHYKPNSRIGICLSRENDSHCDKGIKLEESFTSESSSDTEEAVEIPKDSEESIYCDEEAEDSEDTCATRPVLEISNGCIKRRSGSYLYGEGKGKSVLLVLAIACLSMSITDCPGTIISSYLHNASFSNQLFAPAYENLERAADSFKQWSISYFSEANIFSEKEKTGKFEFTNFNFDHEMCNRPDIIAAENPEKFFPGVDKKGRTGPEEEEHIIEDFTETKLHETREDSKDQSGIDLVEEEKIEQKSKAKEGHPLYSAAEAMQNMFSSELEAEDQNKEAGADHLDYESKGLAEDVVGIVRQPEPQDEEGQSNHESSHPVYSLAEAMRNKIRSELEDEDQNKEAGADHLDYESKEVAEDVVEIVRQPEPQDEEGQSNHESTNNIDKEVAEEIDEAALEAEQLSSQIGEEPKSRENITSDYHTNIKSESTSEEAGSRKLDSCNSLYAENKLWLHIALPSFAFLVLAGLSSTIYLKHKKASAVQPTVFKWNRPPEKLMSCSISALSDGHLYSEGTRNSQMEFEMLGESGPSEMCSSVLKSSSYSQRRKIEDTDRKVRRNSIASDNSAASPSLGSFTTYEMLHGKHGCGEDDALTPVRRSSRIRKKITSP
ncbi:probable GPI-anchored adhesin-like protein PGA55 [Aristolochia californica]|uniref:probable GPI-anchored adhesin-like protein PGA55 n=1 Tax=Aristolochia californica TaxID=171875 RepID=UPI0035E35457